MSEENTIQEAELDFNSDDYNSFYYTSEKQIKKMDDEFILAMISEKYPDLRKDNDENILKQILIVIMNDSKLMEGFESKYDISATEIIKTMYRNYDFLFNKCFITKLQNTIRNKRYAKRAARRTNRQNKIC